jgi:predicted nucleotidyltransferase component of viral defense system
VKFSFFLYRHPTLIEPHKYKSLQIASIDDIAVMKLIAISQRGTKKDFVDLWMILEQGYNLTLLFEFMDRKFEGTKYNKANILKSLTFFEDAESDPDPIMLIAESWQLIRRDLTKAALRL